MDNLTRALDRLARLEAQAAQIDDMLRESDGRLHKITAQLPDREPDFDLPAFDTTFPDTLEEITDEMNRASRYYVSGVGCQLGQANVVREDRPGEWQQEDGIFLTLTAKPVGVTEDILSSFFLDSDGIRDLIAALEECIG